MYCCFYQCGEIYMYINFRSQTFILFKLYGPYTCIAIIMYCQMLILLFTGKLHCLHFGRGTYLQRIFFSLHAKFQVWRCYSFGSTALQQEWKKKNLKRHVSLYFPQVMSKYIYIFLN